MTDTLFIRPVEQGQLPLLAEHFARHYAESGRGERHFTPFPPDETISRPKPLVAEPFLQPLTAPGWQRAFGAFVADGNAIVGHVDLKGDAIPSGGHRCELGFTEIGMVRDRFRIHGTVIDDVIMTLNVEQP